VPITGNAGVLEAENRQGLRRGERKLNTHRDVVAGTSHNVRKS